jgi:UrcA family protein
MKKFYLLLAASLWAAPAFAETGGGSQTVRISYADLDLISPEGKAKLDRRIRTAVQTACGTASDADLEGKNAVRNCRSAAYKAASAQVRLASETGSVPILVASDR